MDQKSSGTLAGSLKAVKKTKVHEQIVNQIKALIDEGRLKHGHQLPPEKELATIFKVSRHSLREAIRILEQKKILKSRPGSGTFIILEEASVVVELLEHIFSKSRHEYSQGARRNRLSIQGHQEIVKAVKGAKPEAASALMAAHLSTIRKFVLSQNNNQEG